MNIEFLSPLQSTTDSAKEYCDIIPTTNTGTFLGTMTGLWEGMASFDYSDAVYQVDVTSFTANMTSYQLGMDYIYEVLQSLSTHMNNVDLSVNILVWCSFSFNIARTQTENLADRFSFTGNPTSIFNRQIVTGSYSSINGICQNISSQAVFDVSTSSFSLTYNYNEFIDNSICKQILIPQYFGYLPDRNSKTFNLQIDVRSLVTAISINFGIATLYQMNIISSSLTTFTLYDMNFTGAQYYDTKHPGMSPIYCVKQLATNATFCSLYIAGNVFALPFLNHVGQNEEYPQSCNCLTLTSVELMNPYNSCNLFRFLSGIIYWNTNDITSVFEIIVKYNGNMLELNQQTYNASFISSYFGRTSSYSNIFQSQQYLQNVFEFCKIPTYGYCSMVTFTAFDSTAYTWTINEYYHQLTNGACVNSLLPAKENW